MPTSTTYLNLNYTIDSRYQQKYVKDKRKNRKTRKMEVLLLFRKITDLSKYLMWRMMCPKVVMLKGKT